MINNTCEASAFMRFPLGAEEGPVAIDPTNHSSCEIAFYSKPAGVMRDAVGDSP